METVVINAIVWFALTPVVVAGILLAFLVLCHYTPVLRTIDAFLLSLLSALLLDILLLVLIQAVLYFEDAAWSETLCRFYVWASVSFRFAELFTAVAFSIDRVMLMRLHGVTYTYYADKLTAALIVVVWMAACFVGGVIVAGWEDVVLFVESVTTSTTGTGNGGVEAGGGGSTVSGGGSTVSGECMYLAHELHERFAIFVCVMEVCCTLICGFCMADAWCHVKYYNARAMVTINTGQGSESFEQWKTSAPVQKSQDMAVAYDNCSTACTVVLILLLVNHVPYAVVSLVGLLSLNSTSGAVDPLSLRLVSLWLLVVQALLVPHCLWLGNRRYRKAVRRLRDWYLCRGNFYTQESRQKAPKLRAYVTHPPQPGTTHHPSHTQPHEPLRRVSGHAQRQGSFHYESFQAPPTKSSSETNIAHLSALQRSGPHFERSRSLEADLDRSSRGRYGNGTSPPPSVGARNLQMDDIIVHGRWDLTDENDGYNRSPKYLNGSQQISHSGSSSSSTHSPRPKRMRMTPTKTKWKAMEDEEGSRVSGRLSRSSSDRSERSERSSRSSSSESQTTVVNKRNKVLTKKSSRNSIPDTSSESSGESVNLQYNDDDIDAGLSEVQTNGQYDVQDNGQGNDQEVTEDAISPQHVVYTPVVPPPASNRKTSQTWEEMYKFDNYIEEIVVPDREVVVMDRDRESESFGDEFSTSEFDETSMDENPSMPTSGHSVLRRTDAVNLYPMKFEHDHNQGQWDDDTLTIIRRPLNDLSGQGTTRDLTEAAVRKGREQPQTPQLIRMSSFGKPLPVSPGSTEDLSFSTDNPLYETLSRKERFEQSKQEIQRVLSMNERDVQEQGRGSGSNESRKSKSSVSDDLKFSEQYSGYSGESDQKVKHSKHVEQAEEIEQGEQVEQVTKMKQVKQSTGMERLEQMNQVEQVEQVNEMEITDRNTNTEQREQTNKAVQSDNVKNGEVIFIPKTDIAGVVDRKDSISRTPKLNTTSSLSSTSHRPKPRDMSNGYANEKPKIAAKPELPSLSKHVAQNGGGSTSGSRDAEEQKRDLVSDIRRSLPRMKRDGQEMNTEDMDGYIYSRGRGKVLGHYGTKSTAC